jgi:hypothetical protein
VFIVESEAAILTVVPMAALFHVLAQGILKNDMSQKKRSQSDFCIVL